jgi:alkylhydroperoxidase/carboxymuconolactone decarboxylase family protein YurZ
VILQCVVYGGNSVLDSALELFARVADELGLLDELRQSQLPRDGRDSVRSLDGERSRWHPEDRDDPRLPDLVARHGWLGVSAGLLVRPREHLNVLAYLDALDHEFALLWERYTYQGMYGRGVLDDRTRILCIIGNCVALGEGIQIRAHIRSALNGGATPREVLEVILQSCVHFGMPATMQALGTLYKVMDEEGRLDEIGNPPFPQREHGR